jgi:hypothetical protein
MEEPEISKKLDRITMLFVANLLVVSVAAVALVVGLIPKLERAVRSTERVEMRLLEFADKVDPILSAGAGKAIQSLENIDTEKLSKTATDASDALIKAAAEKAKAMLEGKKPEEAAK